MAPVLLGYPNVLAGSALRQCSGQLDQLLETADLILVRGPWQVRELLDRSDAPVVYSSHNVEVERFESTQPPFYRLLRGRVRELERVAVEETAATICTSERDANMYRDRFDVRSPLIIAPNGTSRNNIREQNSESDSADVLRERYGFARDTPVVLFVGSNYGPNVEATEHILDIAHRMRSQQLDVQFLIVGTVGNAVEFSAPNVTVTGFVDEFEAHFDIADLALNPMMTGAGTNIKLFDYFARGLPVVSTPFGVRGIEIEAGTHSCVVKLNEFSDAILRLLESPEKREWISRNAQSLVADKYTWETISEQLFHRLKTLIE
jgi:glycosyltransferase involved in cell wall biosynthesis